MKMILLVLAIPALSGCMGLVELSAIRTPEEIQRSEYHAEHVSAKTTDVVNRCMMQTLHDHKNVKGKRPYVDVETREFGSTHEITLRTPHRPAAGMFDVGGELLFLIENSASEASGGTKSNMWVHQRMLSPSPQDSLDTLVGVVKVCL